LDLARAVAMAIQRTVEPWPRAAKPASNVLVVEPVRLEKTLLDNALGHIAVSRHPNVHTACADKPLKPLRDEWWHRHWWVPTFSV